MTCDKIAYESQQAAMSAVHGVSKDKKKSMKAYRCDDCGKYHLATQGKKKRQRNKWRGSGLADMKIKNQKPLNPLPKIIAKTEPNFATEKMISKEQANVLKRLVEGNNNMFK